MLPSQSSERWSINTTVYVEEMLYIVWDFYPASLSFSSLHAIAIISLRLYYHFHGTQSIMCSECRRKRAQANVLIHQWQIHVWSNLGVLFVCLFTWKQQIHHCGSILFSLIWGRFLVMTTILLSNLGLTFYSYRTLSCLQGNKFV